MSWNIEKLGDLTSLISSGSTPRGGSENYLESGPVMFIRSQNVLMNKLETSGISFINHDIHRKMKRTWVHQGDVLLNITGASIGRVASFELANREANVNQHVCIIRPKPEQLYYRYLEYLISTPNFQNEIERSQNGGTRQALNFSQIAKFPIPLPPLPEQKRIAAILDKADSLRQKRQQAITKLDSLLQSVFLEMFGDPVTNPKGWDVACLGEIIDSLRYGTGSPPGYDENDEGIPFIRATNVKNGTVSKVGMKYISEQTAKKIEKCKIKKGDLIFVRSGVNSGDCAIIPDYYDGAYAGYDIIVELPFDWAVFVNHFVNSPMGQHIIKPLTRRAGQPHLNAEQIKNLKIIKPEFEEVVRFRQIKTYLDKSKEYHKNSLNQLNDLFYSLQQRAFKGEL